MGWGALKTGKQEAPVLILNRISVTEAFSSYTQNKRREGVSGKPRAQPNSFGGIQGSVPSMVIPSLFPAASVSKTDPGKGPEHLPFEGEGEDHVLLQRTAHPQELREQRQLRRRQVPRS